VGSRVVVRKQRSEYAEFTAVYDFKKPVKDNITLYARWNANQYTVSFNTNNGSSVAAAKMSQYEKSKRFAGVSCIVGDSSQLRW
jgi:hypothetical protein